MKTLRRYERQRQTYQYISLMDNTGHNLLKPSRNHRQNVLFLTFLSSFILGVSEYHSLLQASVATAGNRTRLGGHEAPPSIMSIYLGEALTNLLGAIEKPDLKMPDKELLDLGLAGTSIIRYDCDRNRTSPSPLRGISLNSARRSLSVYRTADHAAGLTMGLRE